MRRMRLGWFAPSVLLAGLLALFTAGCGGDWSDSVGSTDGRLFVTEGGTGSVFLTPSQDTLNFADSITVAVRRSREPGNQFMVFTFFGVDELSYNQVPEAVLVTFINGLSPTSSTQTRLPSSVVSMALHLNFNRTLTGNNGILAQDAPLVIESPATGTLVLEPQTPLGGGLADQNSRDRRLRYAVLTLTDLDSSAEALIQGAVDYTVSTDVDERLYGYLGNLGLLRRPPVSGGGPPPPPGSSTGGGLGGGNAGGGDGPPQPPL